MSLNVPIQLARKTEAQWASENPTLLAGQIAISSDAGIVNNYKVGPGKWMDLDYVIPDNSDTLAQILDVIAEPPTYTAPTASLTNVTQTVPRGSDLGPLTLNIGFSPGDAGAATGYVLQKNGATFSTSATNTDTITNIQAPVTYMGIVSYAEGATKPNNLGILDPTGKILAGSVTTAVRTITPRLEQFFGPAATVPTNAAEAKALPQKNYENTNTFTLITGATHRRFPVVIPSNKSITNVTDTTNLNANLTSSYVLVDAAFPMVDEGGVAYTAKLYVLEAAVPYSVSANHVITTA